MNNYFRIVGIDPGTTNIGVAILDIDIMTMQAANVKTVNIDVRVLSKITDDVDTLMSRINNLIRVTDLINSLNPNIVIIEKAFINMVRPTAVIPLSNAMGIFYANIDAPLKLMEPMLVKGLLGVLKGREKGSDTKKLIEGVMYEKYKDYPLYFNTMTEHEFDALSIATSYLLNLDIGDVICLV